MNRLFTSLMSLAMLAALSATTLAQKKPAPAATPAPDARAPKEALLLATDDILHQVAGLRGLQPKVKLQRGVLSRQEIGDKLKDRLRKENTPEEVSAEARMLKRMGLLPPDVDYEKLVLDLLMEQVAGFYDPFTAKLYIADWLPVEMQRPALAHEIEHALQDQNFDLKRFASPIKDDGDRQLAHSALVEGDATLLMLQWQMRGMGMPVSQLSQLLSGLGKMMVQSFGQAPQFDKAPEYIKETLLFPYLTGASFVDALKRSKDWSTVDKAFTDSPESTEQVLHPAKYFAKEHPIKITSAPIVALKGYSELHRDVFGEFSLKVWFGLHVPAAEAQKAASGWGGDRLVGYVKGSPDALPVIVHYMVWDTEIDATEAEATLRVVLAKLAHRPPTPTTQPIAYKNDKGEEWQAVRKGNAIVAVYGAPTDGATAIIDQVWAGWKVGRR